MTQYHSTRPVHGLDIAYSGVCSADLIAKRFQDINMHTGARTAPSAERDTWVHCSFRFSYAVSSLKKLRNNFDLWATYYGND